MSDSKTPIVDADEYETDRGGMVVSSDVARTLELALGVERERVEILKGALNGLLTYHDDAEWHKAIIVAQRALEATK